MKFSGNFLFMFMIMYSILKSQNYLRNITCIMCTFILLELSKAVLKLDGEIKQLAEELYQNKSILVMGRGSNYATCLEGALVRNNRTHSVVRLLL